MEGNKNNDEKQIEEEEILKKRICSHPLFDLLVEAHIDCLKISGISEEGQSHSLKQKELIPDESGTSRHPDLDHFMEAYCLALRKLKEAMEEPQHQTVSFINSMHLQLRDLVSPSGEDDNKSDKSVELSL